MSTREKESDRMKLKHIGFTIVTISLIWICYVITTYVKENEGTTGMQNGKPVRYSPDFASANAIKPVFWASCLLTVGLIVIFIGWRKGNRL